MVMTRATNTSSNTQDKSASSKRAPARPTLKQSARPQRRKTGVASNQELCRKARALRDSRSKAAPSTRQKSRSVRLGLATWNTYGWSARIQAHIKTLKKDVIALTECGAKIQAFAGPGLLVAEPPPKGDPAGAAAIHL